MEIDALRRIAKRRNEFVDSVDRAYRELDAARNIQHITERRNGKMKIYRVRIIWGHKSTTEYKDFDINELKKIGHGKKELNAKGKILPNSHEE